MAPRSSWKGFVKLSLVSVPVKAYTANDTGVQVRLNQLHTDCNSRIVYKKVCPQHGELDNDQITRGYEYAKGQYVVIDDDELDKLRTESDRSVNIEGFMAPSNWTPCITLAAPTIWCRTGRLGRSRTRCWCAAWSRTTSTRWPRW